MLLFLEIELDTMQFERHLPIEKLQRVSAEIRQWQGRNSGTMQAAVTGCYSPCRADICVSNDQPFNSGLRTSPP